MRLTATELRRRLYEVLHDLERTGEPVEVELKSTRFVITRAEPASRLARMQPQRDAIVGSPDELADFSPWDEAPRRQGWDERLKDE